MKKQGIKSTEEEFFLLFGVSCMALASIKFMQIADLNVKQKEWYSDLKCEFLHGKITSDEVLSQNEENSTQINV